MPRSCVLDGKGRWSEEAIRDRYARYCLDRNRGPRALPIGENYVRQRGLIVGIMDELVERMKLGDLAAAEVGIELIEEDGGFAFGRIMKANTARALKRCHLTQGQQDRVRRWVVSMLCRSFMPHEFREYARLLRRIGVAEYRDVLLREADRTNPWTAWYLDYLLHENAGPKPGSPGFEGFVE